MPRKTNNFRFFGFNIVIDFCPGFFVDWWRFSIQMPFLENLACWRRKIESKYIYPEPKRPVFRKIWSIKRKVTPSKKRSVGFIGAREWISSDFHFLRLPGLPRLLQSLFQADPPGILAMSHDGSMGLAYIYHTFTIKKTTQQQNSWM